MSVVGGQGRGVSPASPGGQRSAWASVGWAVVVLLVLEIVGRIGLAYIQPGRFRGDPAAFILPMDMDAAARERLAEEYSREQAASYQTAWRPYVYWRRIPYQGKYINVDEAGIRRSWNATPSQAPGQVRIFVFGGSTLWGTGARDEFTIPSLLSKKLSTRYARGVWVTNFGEAGYVNTQEIITLMLELRRGNRPDIAVFFDGYNDSASALQNGVAGIPQNEPNRIAEFNSRSRLNLREGFVNRLALYRFSRWASRSILRPAVRAQRATASTEPLADATVSAYLHNVEILTALSRTFGFHVVFFWQPTLYTKQSLSARERRLYEQSERYFNGAALLFGAINSGLKGRLAEGRYPQVTDLSSMFGDDGDTVFIDQYNHPSEAGNDRIAEAIARLLLKDALAKRP